MDPAQDPFILPGIICGKRGRPEDGDPLPLLQIGKEFLRIVPVFPRLMLAGIKTGAAADAFASVYMDLLLSVYHDRLVCGQHRACGNTFIAADTILIRIY